MVYPVVQPVPVTPFRFLPYGGHFLLRLPDQTFQPLPLVAVCEQRAEVYAWGAVLTDAFFRGCQQFVDGERLVQHRAEARTCQFLFRDAFRAGHHHHGDGA